MNKFSRMGLLTAILILLSTTVIAFQNCSQSVRYEGHQSSKSSVVHPNQNNGTGYGGKTYVRRLLDGFCSDGTNIKARMVTTSSTTAVLSRENCQEIESRTVKVDRVFTGGNKNVTYDIAMVQEQLFDEAARPVTAHFCLGESATRTTRFIAQNINEELTAFLDSVQPSASGANYTLDFPVEQNTGSSGVTYRAQNPANNILEITATVDSLGNGDLDIVIDRDNQVSVDDLACFAHATSSAPEASIPAQPVQSTTGSQTTTTTTTTTTTSAACSNPTLAQKPTTAQFMSLTGTDFQTAASVLSGVIGSNLDQRNWQQILSSADILSAARQATADMYNGTYCRAPGATKAPYSSGGFTVSALATAGNLQLQKQTSSTAQYWIRLIDGEGYELTAISNCASVPSKALNFGFEYSSAMASLKSAMSASSDAAARAWVNSCPTN